MAIIPHQPKWHERILARIIYWAIRIFAACIRFKVHKNYCYNKQIFAPGGKQETVIFSIWHNRLFSCLMQFYLLCPQPTRRVAALVSASRDGGMLSHVLKLYHVVPIRGSSSRRGMQAMMELQDCIKQGYDVAVTPDGPRGPRYKMHSGVIRLAQHTGVPILPISYHLSRKKILHSWDGFQIPFPFCTCTVFVGNPIYVPPHLTNEECEAWREKVNRAMLEITCDGKHPIPGELTRNTDTH